MWFFGRKQAIHRTPAVDRTPDVAELETEGRVAVDRTPDVAELETEGRVDDLVRLLSHQEQRLRLGAADALGRIRDARAAEPLIQLIERYGQGKDGDGPTSVEVTVAAVSALGKIGDDRALPVLRSAARRRDGDVAGAAASALMDLGDNEGLVEALQTGQRSESAAAVAEALGQSGDPRAMQILVRALGSEKAPWDPIATALGDIGDSSAVPALIDVLYEPWGGLRKEVAGALRKIGDDRGVMAVEEGERRIAQEAGELTERRLAELAAELGDLYAHHDLARTRAIGELLRRTGGKSLMRDVHRMVQADDLRLADWTTNRWGDFGLWS